LSAHKTTGYDQQYGLSSGEIYELAEIASTTAILAGKGGYQALKLLEFGRGIVSGFSIDCRSDLSDLRTSYPEHADRFERLRAEIDSPPLANGKQRDRKLLAAEFENALACIRKLPG
jgi:hypothetical protein